MEKYSAVRALRALAHDTRLAIFRLLVQAGREGLAVGVIGRRLDLAPATLFFHLAALRHSNLVTTRRSGRTLFQVADYAAIASLVDYLTANCCGEQGAGTCGRTSVSTNPTENHDETPARTRLRR